MKLESSSTEYSGHPGAKSCLQRTLAGIFLVSGALLLAGCDAQVSDDHGHEHGSEAEVHEHGEGGHSHDTAPATEAYYGEQAETPAAEAVTVPGPEVDTSETQQDSGHRHDDGAEHQHDH